MVTGTTDVFGIEIPSTAPLFLALIGLHVVAGVTSVTSGIGAMLSRKGSRRHVRFGRVYYWSLAVILVSASGLAIVRWAEDWHLVLLGTFAFGAAAVGRQALKRRWVSAVWLHISGMGSSYIVMLTAFYVDNGKSLPLWRDLPTAAYWTLPTLVGLPIVLWAISARRGRLPLRWSRD
jgi:hypothetical protein